MRVRLFFSFPPPKSQSYQCQTVLAPSSHGAHFDCSALGGLAGKGRSRGAAAADLADGGVHRGANRERELDRLAGDANVASTTELTRAAATGTHFPTSPRNAAPDAFQIGAVCQSPKSA